MNPETDLSKFAFIKQYFLDHENSKGCEVMVYSLLNCISEEEITVLYFDYTTDYTHFKDIVKNYIIQRATCEPIRAFNLLARRLLDIYVGEVYFKRLLIRKFLSQFIRATSTDIIKDYFDILSKSDMTVDRYIASKVADLLWSDEVKALLIANYHRKPDEYSVAPLIEWLEPELLCDLAKQYWTPTFPLLKQKKAILKRIIHLDDSYLSFLKERDPFSYLESLTMRNIGITEDDMSTIPQSLTEQEKNSLLWNLGLTGNWERMVKYLEIIQPLPMAKKYIDNRFMFDLDEE